MADYDSQRDEDFRWFMKVMPDLYETHGRCSVIIRYHAVVGVYDNFGDAVRAARKEYGPGNYIVQEVGPDESVYTVHCFGVMPA